jgi:hypothetical protein
MQHPKKPARDKRFLAKVLAHVPGDGRLNTHPAWHLKTILDAVARHERGGAPDEALIDAVESTWADLRRGFTNLELEPDINRRRVMAQEVGPLIGELQGALDSLWRSAEDKLVFGPCRDKVIAVAISELARLCEAKLTDTPSGLAMVVP